MADLPPPAPGPPSQIPSPTTYLIPLLVLIVACGLFILYRRLNSLLKRTAWGKHLRKGNIALDDDSDSDSDGERSFIRIVRNDVESCSPEVERAPVGPSQSSGLLNVLGKGARGVPGSVNGGDSSTSSSLTVKPSAFNRRLSNDLSSDHTTAVKVNGSVTYTEDDDVTPFPEDATQKVGEERTAGGDV